MQSKLKHLKEHLIVDAGLIPGRRPQTPFCFSIDLGIIIFKGRNSYFGSSATSLNAIIIIKSQEMIAKSLN